MKKTGMPWGPSWQSSIVRPLLVWPKRRVFVSYHEDDAAYYAVFSRVFDHTWDFISDQSLDRLYGNRDSDAEYIIRMIREKHISGTSCTLVLCGARTQQRKYVDWEICATLHKQHGLIGIDLPVSPLPWLSLTKPPVRLADNYWSGYAIRGQWWQLTLTPWILDSWIGQALGRRKDLIDNSRPTMRRNLSVFGL